MKRITYGCISLLLTVLLVLGALPGFALAAEREPVLTVTSSHTINYGSAANLTDGVYGGYGVDSGGWLYVQTAGDGTDNHVTFDVDLGGAFPIYETGIGTIVNGWAEPMQNLTVSYSQNSTDYTELATFDNDELAAGMGHRHTWTAQEDSPVTASKLRYEFDIVAEQITDGKVHYTCMDEIDVRTQPKEAPPEIVDPDKGDSVNLAAGKSYTTAWEPDANYADSGRQLTDGVYCRTLSCHAPEWVGYYNQENDGFAFVVDLEETKSFEQIKMNFLREEHQGIPTPLQVRVELSDDGNQWRTLASVDVTPTEDALGIKRFVYTVPEAKLADASARYVKLHVNFRIWMFIDEIEIFDKKTPDQGTELPPDDQPSVNLAKDLPMDCTRELLYNAPDNILTDEITASAPWNTTTWLSFNGTAQQADDNRIAMVYDLGGKMSVSEIRLGVLNDSANGVSLPSGVKLELSDNGSRWTTLKQFRPGDLSVSDPDRGEYVWDGKNDPFLSTTEGADMVYFQYLRITFDCSGIWCAFDELTVMGKNGKCTTAGTLLGTPDSAPNLALGKTYTLSHQAVSAYKDTENKELTDGALGSQNMYDSAWQGHSGEWPIRTVVLDLEKTYSLEEISMNFLQSGGSGIQAPTRFCIYVSHDGETWAKLYDRKYAAEDDGIAVLGWKGGEPDSFAASDAAKVEARYVRVDAELGGWLFFDELEVYGTENLEGAAKLEQNADFTGAYLQVGADTGHMQDMVLMYNGPYRDYEGNPGYGNWSPADCKPYIAYVDETGKALDTMFDGALFLAQTAEPTGNLFIESSGYNASPSTKADWDWYLTKTIDRGGDLDSLDQAVKEAAEELNRPDLKIKISVMVPFPDPRCTDFGTVEGQAVDMSRDEDARLALDWYMEEVLTRLERANYTSLEFAGFYWMHETNYRADRIAYASEKAEKLGYPMLWIPFYNASGWNRGEEMGLGGVALQPNHFFPDGGPSMDRIRDAATLARMYGLGVELELDDRVFHTLDKYNKYLDYLNGGLEYGYLGQNGQNNQVYRNWYNGIKTLMEAATGVNPYTKKPQQAVRDLYDFTYQAIHGAYERQNYRDSLEDPIHTHSLTAHPAVRATCTRDGSKAYYQCTDCGKLFPDQACTEETTWEALRIPAKGHDFGPWKETKEGVEARTCGACGKTETRALSQSGSPFRDVPEDAFYAEPVAWAVSRGIAQGMSKREFAPDRICTRSQVVTFLWRAAGSPEPKNVGSFSDVPASAYYAKAVAWAVENGITTGTGEGMFSPDAVCTRAQAVTFLWRYENAPAAGRSNPFTDVAADSYYADAVLWAVKEDITKGTTSTTFAPDADCTRAQIVTFLWRCKK